jgi:hypothetical protein
LDKERAEFRAEAGGLSEKSLEQRAAVAELGGVGDGLGEFDGEAEAGGRGGGPTLPGFAHVGSVEAGVDFYATETVGVTLEVGELSVAGGREGGGVVFGEGPAGGADVEVVEWGRVGSGGFHAWTSGG